ncbi:alpha/beta fold hydrolase [Actinomadura sp. LOL_016]|uniref:alpha/beta fold hydrolase n=1 Tax=unclassified Actinomadura TaxID=2626254 RepID=UPI003A8101E4
MHPLLAELTDEPAFMLGCSLGASIGFHVAVDHPGQISALIAHEPVAPRLLPADQRAHHEQESAHIQEVHRREGLAATFKVVAEVLGIDPADRGVEPGLTPQPMTSQRVRNFDFFVEHDFAAVIGDTLDVSALAGTPTRIVPCAGRTTPRTVFDNKCAFALADLLGTDLHEFPGGHNGNTARPSAYAAAVRTVLDASEVLTRGSAHEARRLLGRESTAFRLKVDSRKSRFRVGALRKIKLRMRRARC